MVEGKGLLVEHVETRARDRSLSDRGHQRGLVDDRPARRVDQVGRRLHPGQLGGAQEPARAVAEHEVNAHHVGAGQQLVLGHEGGADLGGARGREVLAPGDHVHLERAADLGHARAQPAESDDAEGLAVQAEPAAHLPPTLTGRAILDRNAPDEGEDESPRQLGRRIGKPRRSADDDPALHRRAHVDGRIAHSRRHQELEPRQSLEEWPRRTGCARAWPPPRRSRRGGRPPPPYRSDGRRRPPPRSPRADSPSRPCDGPRLDSRPGSRHGSCV